MPIAAGLALVKGGGDENCFIDCSLWVYVVVDCIFGQVWWLSLLCMVNHEGLRLPFVWGLEFENIFLERKDKTFKR